MNCKQRAKKVDILIVMVAMLAVAVAMTGVSFARYATSVAGDPSNTRVAKWGFVIDVDADGMFAGTGGGNASLTPDDNGLSVASEGVDISPDTSGSIGFSITGTAEVTAKISFLIPDDLEIVCLKNREGEVVYSPILWTLTKNGEELVTKGDLASVKSALAESTVDINEAVNDSYTLKWEWPPEKGESEQDKTENNGYDTMLAKYKADPENNPLPEDYTAVLNFHFNMTIDVSQIQTSEMTE